MFCQIVTWNGFPEETGHLALLVAEEEVGCGAAAAVNVGLALQGHRIEGEPSEEGHAGPEEVDVVKLFSSSLIEDAE